MKKYYLLIVSLLFFACGHQVDRHVKEQNTAIDSNRFDSLRNANSDRILWANLWEGMTEKEFNYAINELKKEKIIETRSEYLCGSLSIIDREMYDFSTNNRPISFIFNKSFKENNLQRISLVFTSITQADAPQICTVVQAEIETMISLLTKKYGMPEISDSISPNAGTKYEWHNQGRIIILSYGRNSTNQQDLKNANPKKLTEFASIAYTFEAPLVEEIREQQKLDSLQKIKLQKSMERL